MSLITKTHKTIKAILIATTIIASHSIIAAPQQKFDYPDTTKDVSNISFYKQTNATFKHTPINQKPKNVILLIGDGMGISQVSLARIKALGKNGYLSMEKMPITGLIHTHSADDVITDSASSATAFACGIKTNNGMIGMDPNKQRYKSILTILQEKNYNTGLVVTSTITHATPAAFAAHVPSRSQEAKIAEHILDAKVNVLFGGGKKFWIPKSQKNSKRNDQRNLMQEAKTQGYQIVNNRDELANAKGPYVLGLFNTKDKGLTTFSPEPSLPQMTDTAINLLDAPQNDKTKKPFFLLVEGSQIDWAGHANNTQNVIKQTLLFDMAIEKALLYAQKNKDTLVIVTADHETGGLSIVRKNYQVKTQDGKWSTGFHTPIPVPLYAYGPGAENFTGTYDNTLIPRKIANLLNITQFPQKIK